MRKGWKEWDEKGGRGREIPVGRRKIEKNCYRILWTLFFTSFQAFWFEILYKSREIRLEISKFGQNYELQLIYSKYFQIFIFLYVYEQCIIILSANKLNKIKSKCSLKSQKISTYFGIIAIF